MMILGGVTVSTPNEVMRLETREQERVCEREREREREGECVSVCVCVREKERE